MKRLSWCVLALFALWSVAACNDDGDGNRGTATDTDVDTDADTCPTETATEISQYGITWTFAEGLQHGVFANGDPWVVGPATITGIAPEFDGSHHGWQVNPTDVSFQGFDARVADFSAALVPSLPYAAQPGESIVKGVSLEPLSDTDCRPCLDTAAVLTVLAAPPADCGKAVFRPPYFGTDKKIYSAADLRTDLLPALAAPATAPTLIEVADGLRRVQLDHKEGPAGRALHPAQNLPDYGSDISTRSAEAALRLALDDSSADKREVLVAFVQFGIDLYHMFLGGQKWTANGGHAEGRKLPVAFAAVLLDDADMQDAVRNAGPDVFGENGGMYASSEATVVLWGQQDASEDIYWNNIVFDTGSRTVRDPYHWIDGGYRPGDGYQFCCTSASYKANAVLGYLMPEIREVWNHEEFYDYVERWLAAGAWTQPDPCSPPDGVCAGGDHPGTPCTSASEPDVCTGTDASCDLTAGWNAGYGITYGPDGSGGCILDTDMSDGTGRFPSLHGANADGGYHGSSFSNDMWTSYVAPTL